MGTRERARPSANDQARQGVPSYLKKPNSKLYLSASFAFDVDCVLTRALPLLDSPCLSRISLECLHSRFDTTTSRCPTSPTRPHLAHVPRFSVRLRDDPCPAPHHSHRCRRPPPSPPISSILCTSCPAQRPRSHSCDLVTDAMALPGTIRLPPPSLAPTAAFLGFLGVGLAGNMYYLVQYARVSILELVWSRMLMLASTITGITSTILPMPLTLHGAPGCFVLRSSHRSPHSFLPLASLRPRLERAPNLENDVFVDLVLLASTNRARLPPRTRCLKS